MRLASRIGSAGLAAYFWIFVLFLFSPLVVLLIFSVNSSPTPTVSPTHSQRCAFPVRRMRNTRNETSAQLSAS